MKRLLTKLEAANLLGVSWRTIDRLRKKGLPAILIGRQVKFDEDLLKEWLRKQQQ